MTFAVPSTGKHFQIPDEVPLPLTARGNNTDGNADH